MRLHSRRLLADHGFLLGDAQLLQQRSRGALDTAREFAALAGVEQLHELGVGHLQEFVQVDTAVHELLGALSTLFQLLRGELRLHEISHLVL